MTTIKDKCEALIAAHEAATPGPWDYRVLHKPGGSVDTYIIHAESGRTLFVAERTDDRYTASLACDARNDAPEIAAAYLALEAAAEEMAAFLWRNSFPDDERQARSNDLVVRVREAIGGTP